MASRKRRPKPTEVPPEQSGDEVEETGVADVTATLEFDLQVPGAWYARGRDNSSSVWKRVAMTPGKLRMQAGLAYRFEASGIATDDHLSDLNRLPTPLLLMDCILRKCSQVTDAGLTHMKHLTAMQTLVLTGWSSVTDAGLAHLRGLTALQWLNLYRCERVTDAGLAHLKDLTALQTLDLGFCVQVTDAGLAHLRGLTALQTLKLSGCEGVTDDGLADLRTYLPRCRVTR
jgi:hypothetical protein